VRTQVELYNALCNIFKAVEALSAARADCIVVFSDAYDVLWQKSLPTLRRDFLAMRQPLVFLGECGCWPQVQRGPAACTSQYPKAPTQYRVRSAHEYTTPLHISCY
jgi:hypothetical protein